MMAFGKLTTASAPCLTSLESSTQEALARDVPAATQTEKQMWIGQIAQVISPHRRCDHLLASSFDDTPGQMWTANLAAQIYVNHHKDRMVCQDDPISA